MKTDRADHDGLSHECTSWMVFGDLTKNNTRLLHKNRDAGARDLLPMKSPEGAARKWIGLGDIDPRKKTDPENVCMGLNASGLAAAVNSGEKTTEPSDPDADTETPDIIKLCLAQCDTAAQAVEKLEEIRCARRYAHGDKGSIFLFMDLAEGFIVDMTADRRSVARYDGNYVVRANIWHNPGMASAACGTAASWLESCNREYMAIRGLNRALRSNGKITVADAVAIARDTVLPEDSPFPRTLCYKTTNSASTLELNCAFPDVLSTGYFLIGPPRQTILVPVPVCVEAYLSEMTDLRWSSAAWKLFEAKGHDAEIPPAWLTFEADALAAYKAAQAAAEELLKAGKRADAVRLLNDRTRTLWQDAAQLLGLA